MKKKNKNKIKTSSITLSFSSFLPILGVNLQLFLFPNLTLDMCQVGQSGHLCFSFTDRLFGISICFCVFFNLTVARNPPHKNIVLLLY